MSVDMYLSQSDSQATSSSAMCQQQIQGYEELQKAISSFTLTTPFLRGAAYDSAKAYFSAVLFPLAQGGLLLTEAVGHAVKKFPETYRSQVDSKDLKEEELKEQIRQADLLIQQAEELKSSSTSLEAPDLLKDLQFFQKNQSLINIHQSVKKDLEEKLAKLMAFHASSPSIFSEIATLESAVQQGLSQTKTAWDSSKGIFVVPNAEKLAWSRAIAILNQASEKTLSKRLDEIKKGGGTPFEKSEAIIKAYEDYLFANNKEGFEKYWSARSSYGNSWPKDVGPMKEYIENELSKSLINSDIDIKEITKNMGDDILEVNKFNPMLSPVLPIYKYGSFYNLVQTGQPLDLKTRSYSGEYDFSLWSRQWNVGMPEDYLGNYLYGYVGQGYLTTLNLPKPWVLKIGAGAAQGLSDKDFIKYIGNLSNGNFGDNPNDSHYINDGIVDYKSRK
ncbi:polymorphic toxin type 44 domain-containing protein [Listeria fleischmannii]|uniref:polymorphic toxin type 44 domain-containing protein n=1 Tax=Listeria fleischmannii TaxID=1069827 RepID=UPI0016240DBB|nr:polymorphic toxin type 44 domain-containing protein [Listeria fleischmannii]MBC1419907.1 hypothetical protein [Listeria fleischmannii]